MPKNSDNLNLKLYDSSADGTELSKEWFADNFGYSNSNLTKIDNAYKEQNDKINDLPSKTGTGATGTWGIDISGSSNSAVHDGAGNDINSTYISEIEVGDTKITYQKGDGTSVSLSIKTDETLNIDGMPADAKAVGDMIKSSLYPTLIVNIDAGSAVTISLGDYSFTETTNEQGNAEFHLPVLGVWAVKASLDTKHITGSIDIDILAKKYELNLVYFVATLTVNAVPNAVVVAKSNKQTYTQTADSDGNAIFRIEYAGAYNVDAIYENVHSNSEAVSLLTDGDEQSVSVSFITITVTCDTGSTVVVQKDEESITKQIYDDSVKFYIPSTGTWDITSTLGDYSGSGRVETTEYTDYTIKIYYSEIFGVMWNYSNSSTALTRLKISNDPNGYVHTDITKSASAAIGTDSGSSPFDNYYPWNKMEEYNIVNNAVGAKYGESGFSRSSNDVVVYIPEFWYKIIDDADNSKRYFYISDKNVKGFEKHPGSGKYVGRYNTISGHYSRTGKRSLVSTSRTSFRTNATAKGDKWSLYDYSSWCAVWLLYLVEYADWDSQSKIGKGYTADANSDMIINGGTDTMTYHTGRAAGTDGKTAVQYRHIENPWGNVFEWIDGVNFSDGTVYTCTDYTKYADDTSSNYTNIGAEIQSNGYITKIGYSTTAPWSFYPTAVNGSATTYIPDYASFSSGWRALYVGGDWVSASYAGLFYFRASRASSATSTSLGARLLFNP